MALPQENNNPEEDVLKLEAVLYDKTDPHYMYRVTVQPMPENAEDQDRYRILRSVDQWMPDKGAREPDAEELWVHISSWSSYELPLGEFAEAKEQMKERWQQELDNIARVVEHAEKYTHLKFDEHPGVEEFMMKAGMEEFLLSKGNDEHPKYEPNRLWKEFRPKYPEDSRDRVFALKSTFKHDEIEKNLGSIDHVRYHLGAVVHALYFDLEKIKKNPEAYAGRAGALWRKSLNMSELTLVYYSTIFLP